MNFGRDGECEPDQGRTPLGMFSEPVELWGCARGDCVALGSGLSNDSPVTWLERLCRCDVCTAGKYGFQSGSFGTPAILAASGRNVGVAVMGENTAAGDCIGRIAMLSDAVRCISALSRCSAGLVRASPLGRRCCAWTRRIAASSCSTPSVFALGGCNPLPSDDERDGPGAALRGESGTP